MRHCSLVILIIVTLLCVTDTPAGAQGATVQIQQAATISGGSGGGGQASSEGDLWLPVICDVDGWAITIDDPLLVRASLSVAGEPLLYREVFGWGEVSFTLNKLVRASTEDRAVFCEAIAGYGSGSSSATLLSSGPGSGTVVIRSFIPDEWVQHPYNPGVVFGGDNRGFNAYGVTGRTNTVYDVFNPAVNNADVLSGPFNETGLSQSYDYGTSVSNGHLIQAAKDDWILGPPQKLDWGFAPSTGLTCSPPERLGTDDYSSTHQFTCVASVTNPLIGFAPSLDYEFTVKLRWGNRKIEYWVTGCHDEFPNYEIYINGQPILQDSATSGPLGLLFCSSVQVHGFVNQ